MITYLELKEKFVENEQRVMFALASLIIFLLGFGTGRGYAEINPPKPYNTNYATKQEQTPAAPANKTPVNKTEPTVNKTNTSAKTTPKPGEPCPIKGSSSKIYHVKGGAFYDRTNPKQCFNTEAEAQAAGFRKSSR